MSLTEGHCDVCDAVGPLLDELCESCAGELYEGPLSPWMVRLLFEEASWRTPAAWREYLDAVAARRGSEHAVTAWNLKGPMWARRVLDDVESP